jgi:hypothetical protein
VHWNSSILQYFLLIVGARRDGTKVLLRMRRLSALMTAVIITDQPVVRSGGNAAILEG